MKLSSRHWLLVVLLPILVTGCLGRASVGYSTGAAVAVEDEPPLVEVQPGVWVVEDYNERAHSETKQAPARRWAAGGWLPRMPESREQLDMLLLRVARPRVVHRDGIRFEGQRYLALTLAGYVGEAVTIRGSAIIRAKSNA